MACKRILVQEGQAVLMTFPKSHSVAAKNIISKRKGGFNDTALALVNVKKL